MGRADPGFICYFITLRVDNCTRTCNDRINCLICGITNTIYKYWIEIRSMSMVNTARISAFY